MVATPETRSPAHSARFVAVVAALLAGASCVDGGPALAPIGNQVTAVGEELVVELRAEGGSGLTYDVHLTRSTIAPRATLSARPDGSAVWTYRPNARDVGTFVVEFEAIDATGSTSEAVEIEVRSVMGSATLPVFQRPVGTGTVVESNTACVEIPILLTDQDSTDLRITIAGPKLEASELTQDNHFGGTWRWCPTPAQRAARDRYMITIEASDGENPAARKHYQIILRDAGKPACAGAPPVIVHQAADAQSVNDLPIVAIVTDELGLKGAPFVHYATTPPPEPLDLSKMTQIAMRPDTTDQAAASASYRAELPNPLRGMPPGSQMRLYYVIVAEDNDDAVGDCDHVVTQTFEMAVSTPGGDGMLGLCAACSSDAQCGDADDNCLRVGVEGSSHCFRDCAAGCPTGYVCSPNELLSVDGKRARQCVPVEERCAGPAGDCRADATEPNDGLAASQPMRDSIAGRICPLGSASEEDWFAIDVTGDSSVTLRLAGAGALDVDLALFDPAGRLIAVSESATASEMVTSCLPSGRYHARVYSYFAGRADYTLSATRSPQSCSAAWWGECRDDALEEDDTTALARRAEVEPGYTSRWNQVCAHDDDWYEVYLYEGETLNGTLAFALQGAAGDLDLLVRDSTGSPITSCSETYPAGCTDNGQSSGAGERMSYLATYTGVHYVVVHGWGGGENAYDICLSVNPAGCP